MGLGHALLNKILHRGPEYQGSEFDYTLAGSMMAADVNRSSADNDFQKELGSNYHMTESRELMDTLKRLSERPYVHTNPDGSTLSMIYYHPVFTQLAVEINALHCQRWLDPEDAEIAFWQVRGNFQKARLQLTYEEVEQWSGLVDALERLALEAISDSKGGRKAKLMKVTLRAFELQVNRPTKTTSSGHMPEGGAMPR